MLHLPVLLQFGGSGTEIVSDNEGEGVAGGSKQKLTKPLHMPGEKSATGGIKTETASPHEDTNPASINDLIKAMTEAFKLSVDKPSTSNSDSIGRNIYLTQPKPYSLGQNFKVWLSQFDEYSKLTDIPEQKKKAFMITLLDQPAYRAVQLLRIPESTSYQEFLERITFDSGKSTEDYKMILRARQQNASEDIEADADNLLELAENAYPDADNRFKEELEKDRFLEGVRCSDGCREQCSSPRDACVSGI